MKGKKIKFDLIENAKDSLTHAVEHFTKQKKPAAGDLKRVILDVAHVVELLLKERIRRIHPAFMWENVDKYPSLQARTIGTNRSVSRLCNLEGIALPGDSEKTIKICREIRNSIEHYEFKIELKKARVIVGRMLSFIFYFSKVHLGLDLEADFKQDRRWDALIEIFEFWEAHRETLENQLMEAGENVCECPACGALTYNLSEEECAFCGHYEERLICSRCNKEIWESEAEIIETVNGDEKSGLSGFNITMCWSCFEKEREKGLAAEAEGAAIREEAYIDEEDT